MGFADMKGRAEAREEAAAEARRDAFKVRVASQQFLKHHTPLLRAFLRMGGNSKGITQRGVFEEKAREARSLAMAIAARVLNKPVDTVTMAEARHFRLEAAEIVALAWEEDREVDMAAVAESVGGAVASADDAYDDDTVRWAQVSGNGSATMTAASVTLALARSVMIYDFRLGHNFVLSTLTATVVEAVRQAVDAMAPDQATTEDRRSLGQTTMQSFCAIMAQIYEDAARESFAYLVNLDEDQRRAWLRSRQPLESVVSKFKVWTSDITQVATAAARETMAAAREQKAPPAAH
jgi:hypothetical protein